MILNPVKSSQIASIGHDPATNTLGIKFNTGGVYHYKNVTADQFKEIKEAKSVGSHFYKHIKGSPDKFPFQKQD